MTTENEVNPDVIKQTQETLGKYVKKPAFTDKLLKKPPFRFLHDVINVIIKETGTLNGLYTKSELVSDNIKDRDSKIVFLQKLIDVIKIVANDNITTRPSKIVAGHEPEKTNEMLQSLGKIIDEKLDCSKAIEQVLSTKLSSKSIKKTKANELTKDKKPTNEKIPAKPAPVLKKQRSKENEKTNTTTTLKVSKPKEGDKSKPKIKLNKTESTESEKSKKIDKKNSTASKAKALKDSPKLIDVEVKQQSLENVKEGDEQSNVIQEQNTQKIEKIENEIINQESNEQTSIESKRKISDINPSSQEQVKSANKGRKNSNQPEDQDLIANDQEKLSSGKSSGSGKSRKSSTEKNLSLQKNESIEPVLLVSNEKDKSPSKQSVKENKNRKTSAVDKSGENKSKPPQLKRQSTFTRDESKENDSTDRTKTSLRVPSARPVSARPGAPRRRDKSNIEIVLQPNDQVKLAGIQVKLDSFNAELEDDGENLVIIENSNTNDLGNFDENILGNQERNKEIETDNQQGHLVHQILETQKELIHTNDQEDDKNNTKWDIDTIQKRQSSAKQMDSLRDVIQSLTRSINPLGKLMDFIPEDIDLMQLELTMWRDSYSQAFNELNKEKSLTESALEPMKNQLSQINANIKELNENIDVSHAKILHNSEKIRYLLIEQ